MSFVETIVQQYVRAPYPNDKKFGPYPDLVARNNIPADERYEMMVVGVLDADGSGTPVVYILLDGITNAHWEVFGFGTGSGSVDVGKYASWTWQNGVDVGGTHLDFVIPGAVPNEIAGVSGCILFVDKSLQTDNFTVETTVELNDTIRILGTAGDELPTAEVNLWYNRPAVGVPPHPIPSYDDKNITSNVTTSDGDPSGAIITSKPEGYVQVMVNGTQQVVSYGDKTGDCYFSGDGGTTARAAGNVTAGDGVYWNGSIAGFELNADTITLNYNI